MGKSHVATNRLQQQSQNISNYSWVELFLLTLVVDETKLLSSQTSRDFGACWYWLSESEVRLRVVRFRRRRILSSAEVGKAGTSSALQNSAIAQETDLMESCTNHSAGPGVLSRENEDRPLPRQTLEPWYPPARLELRLPNGLVLSKPAVKNTVKLGYNKRCSLWYWLCYYRMCHWFRLMNRGEYFWGNFDHL